MRFKQSRGKFSGLFIDNNCKNYNSIEKYLYVHCYKSVFLVAFLEKTGTETHKVAEIEKTQTIEENSRQKIAKERGDACQWSKSK